MKGYAVNMHLDNSSPEISRQVILPKKLTFNDLEKIIYAVFSFDGYHNSDFYFEKSADIFYDDRTAIVDDYIDDTIYFHYDYGDDWLIVINLKEIIEYNKGYATFDSYTGDYNPIEDCGGVFALNNMDKKQFRKINPKSIQKKLLKIKTYNFDAYDIKIKFEKSGQLIWRDFLIPFKTTFKELEEIIKITFGHNASFSIDDYVDKYFKKQSKMFSDAYEFSIIVKNTVKYDKTYPELKRFKGGSDPFVEWCKHYPCDKIDIFQTRLDDF